MVFGSVLLGRLQGKRGRAANPGMFINTLPLRLRLHGGEQQRSWSSRRSTSWWSCCRHEQASWRWHSVAAGSSAAPLFTALLNYRHSAVDLEPEWCRRCEGVDTAREQERTNYPLTVSVDDWRGVRADGADRSPRRSQRMLSYLHTAVESLVEALEQAPQTPALALAVLPERASQIIEIQRDGGGLSRKRSVITSCSRSRWRVRRMR